jgi:CxxC motif-containing protein (DUF1111 family)
MPRAARSAAALTLALMSAAPAWGAGPADLVQTATTATATSTPPAPARPINREAFSQALRALEGADLNEFLRGRSLFRRAWVVGPVAGDVGVGLGPLYNRLSCIACHPAHGRGRAPDEPGERMQSMLVRLSLPGSGPHGGPRPHPAYGDQLNEEGTPGVAGEAQLGLTWRERPVRLPDGEMASLRTPQLAWHDPAYGPVRGMLTSARVGPAVFGLGRLDELPEATLEALARAPQPDGVRGRLNRVWDPVQRAMRIGRFGWKANTASLAAQVVQAAAGDLGLSSPPLPGTNCAPRQTACLAAAARATPQPELGQADVQALTRYLRELAPPPPRDEGTLNVERGRQLFARAGCVACHRDSLPAPGGNTGTPWPAYTDLLLHDMGPGLADGRPDFRAGARQWRTAPLWGLGLVPTINEHSQYLHDGRARNLQEAVLWHDGEARAARQRFTALSRDERQALLAFVASR